STVNYLYSDRKDNRYRVVGVVRDLVTTSPTEQVRPAIYMLGGDANAILIKINPKMSTIAALPKIGDAFKKINPGAPFDYKFASDEYAKKFNSDERVLYLASFFTAFAIFISCLGLFGLASFMAEQRTREIGVRKVLGATVLQLWGLLSRDFLGLVCIAFLIALPLGWFGMNRWLQGYDYRTGISIWTFFVVLAGSLVITIATISYQSIKASLTNPAKSLRTE
ncbi:MAG: FtsX-like permease family protein, partial [Bacteroidetes bacterium]|nr:FtsX-like permease family protein [Bacteroidota bacterium]